MSEVTEAEKESRDDEEMDYTVKPGLNTMHFVFSGLPDQLAGILEALCPLGVWRSGPGEVTVANVLAETVDELLQVMAQQVAEAEEEGWATGIAC